jgi:hypothetical protein
MSKVSKLTNKFNNNINIIINNNNNNNSFTQFYNSSLPKLCAIAYIKCAN